MERVEDKKFGRVIARGLHERCPNCGIGRLFKSYLKQVERCAKCGERLGHIRADDAPPWLTISIVGLVVGALALGFQRYVTLPDWAASLMWSGVAVGLCTAVLPRAKGVVIGLIWASHGPDSE
jgi:uncharacterized protein (DUF983 family)